MDGRNQKAQKVKGEGRRIGIGIAFSIAFLFIASLVFVYRFAVVTVVTAEDVKAAESASLVAQAEMHYEQASKYYEMLIDAQARLAAATVEAELYRQQALRYRDRLIDAQAELEILRTKVPQIVEVEKRVPQTLREFENLAQLIEWLEKNTLPMVILFDKDGRIDFHNPKLTSSYDCDHYAEALQRKALQQGFLMSQQVLLNGTLCGIKVSRYTEPHMGNLTVIGNDVYYVESVPPHKVVKVAKRD